MMGQDEPDDRAKLLAAMRAQPAADLQSGQEAPVADAWLERRLRVFERALNALEVRAEASARDQARAVAQLEEKLLALAAASQAKPVSAPEQKIQRSLQQMAEAVRPRVEPDEPAPETPKKKPIPASLALEPPPEPAVSREEMADVLQAARSKARPVEEPAPPPTGARMRWMAIGALSLVALFLCASLTLGDSARATSSEFRTDSTTYRRVAAQGLSRTIAVADSGDARAQAALALAYLRGAGVNSDPSSAARWSAAAARGGEPMGQYLLGALYGQGEGVKADPVRAFELFSAAAARGNLKAMHNLAIAYVEGNGTPKNQTKAVEWFTRAAERGYVDSAFDMGVLYERGMGVTQDLTQALKWYAIAAKAGDAHSRERVGEFHAPGAIGVGEPASSVLTPGRCWLP
jgi:localization factor PodJL